MFIRKPLHWMYRHQSRVIDFVLHGGRGHVHEQGARRVRISIRIFPVDRDPDRHAKLHLMRGIDGKNHIR